jgi:hypothetical protein
MAELGAFFGNPNIQRQGVRARALAGQRDVNTLPDPLTYAVMQGLLGTRPDEMGFSVLNPNYEKIKKVAEPAFALGLLGQAAPALAPLTKGMPVGASIKNVGEDLLSYRGTHTAPNAKKYGATLDDLTKILPDDVYSQEGKRLYGIGDRLIDSEWRIAALKTRGKPDAEIEIFRAVPKGVKEINDGDWVSTSKAYAKTHGEGTLNGEYDIISKKVKAKTLSTEGYPYEYGYNEIPSTPTKKVADYPLAPAGTRYEEFGGELTYMTPDEYLSRVRPLELDDVSLENIAALKSHVQSGGQLDPLHIYQSGKEDGRHRAYMAKELGIEKIPVALHTEANNLGQNLPMDALSLLAEQKRKEITGLLE